MLAMSVRSLELVFIRAWVVSISSVESGVDEYEDRFRAHMRVIGYVETISAQPSVAWYLLVLVSAKIRAAAAAFPGSIDPSSTFRRVLKAGSGLAKCPADTFFMKIEEDSDLL
jgi:hypothetical protein